MPLPALILAGAVMLAGCTVAGPAAMTHEHAQTATLRLALDRDPSLQRIASDVARYAITFTFQDQPTVLKEAVPAADSYYLDISGLPTGQASLHVKAYGPDEEILGEAYTMVLLIPGRRSFAHVMIQLHSAGKSNLKPFNPLTPIADENPYGSRLIGRVRASVPEGQTFEVRPFITYGSSRPSTYSYFRSVVAPGEAAPYYNLSDGLYVLGIERGYHAVAASMPKRPVQAFSPVVTVTAVQTEVPEVELDLDWDLTSALPAINTVLPSREVTFEWPVKPGVTDPKYAIEIYAAVNTNWEWDSSNAPVPVQRYETSAYDPLTKRTKVTFTLNDQVEPGQRYYMLKYWEGSGSYGGANAFGRTDLIPFLVPTR
jgi:hypothetical protein